MAERRKTVKMLLPSSLLLKLDPILKERKLKLEEVVALYLRSLVNASGKALALDSEMPIGKYRGATVESIIRAEPRYMAWLISQDNTTVKLAPEALALLEEVSQENNDD